MKVGFMVACQFAGQLEGGAPLIVGIFRQIHTPLPGVIAPFYLAMEIEAEPHEAGEHEFELRFIDEDGRAFFSEKLICQFRQRPDLGPSYSYFAEVVFIREPVQRAGLFRLDLLWQDQPLGELRLEVCPG